MKTKNVVLSIAFLLTFLTVAWAADVDGKWTAQVPGRQGNTQEVTFNLKAEGEKLTGTMSGRQGDTAISDGKITGNKLSFNVVREFNGNSLKLVYNGVLTGDEIKFTRTMEGGPGGGQAQEFTAKRVK